MKLPLDFLPEIALRTNEMKEMDSFFTLLDKKYLGAVTFSNVENSLRYLHNFFKLDAAKVVYFRFVLSLKGKNKKFVRKIQDVKGLPVVVSPFYIGKEWVSLKYWFVCAFYV